MNRRNFIKTSSAAGIGLSGLAAIPSTSFAAEPLPETKLAAEFGLNELTIEQLQKKMQSGEHTSRSITELYLKRIETLDKNGIHLNSVIELNPDALAIADTMDAERKAGKVRSAMHGIPVLIKDNINTGDKMMTTAGSLAMLGHVASSDAFIIKNLREAGAVLLGKTNLSEWANIRSTRSASGWSSRGGQTKNPVVLDRNPCGSSSGSAAAVAANLCAVAIGTETDGSVTAPSSYCGIVGMKPTVGLLSRSGIIPISKTQDTAGPMARTVKDVAILLSALTGTDPQDLTTQASEGKTQKDYSLHLDAKSLTGKRIGIEKSFLQGHEGVVALYRQAIEALKKAGAIPVEVELIKSFKEFSDSEILVLKYELKDGLNKYLSSTNAKVKTLEEVIQFNNRNETTTMPYFKQEIFEDAQTKGTLDSPEYTNALTKTLSARTIIDELLTRERLDAICATTIGPACCIDLINGDYDTGFYFGSPAAMAGYPHITVPMGKVHELPVGFSFISTAYKEADLLNYAYAFEQATKKRQPPMFLRTMNPK
jgi:amidase